MSDPISAGSVSVQIVPSAEGFKEKVDALTRGESVNIKLNVDTGDAEAKLAAVDAETKAVGDSAGRSAVGIRAFSGGISAIGVGVAGLLPALPVLTAGVAGFGGIFAAAGASAVSFGAVFETALKQATTANTELAAAQKAVNDATTSASRNKALEEQAALVAQLGPNTIQLGTAIKGIDAEWTGFVNGFVPQVTSLVNQFAGLGSDVLPQLAPLVQGTFGVVAAIVGQLDAAVTSPGGQRFFAWLAAEGPRDVLGLVEAVGHLGSGFAHLAESFTPLEHQLLTGLDNITAKFATWAAGTSGSASFQSFLKTAEEEGPKLVGTLGDIGSALTHLVGGFSPLLPYELQTLDFIAKLISNHPALASTLADMFAGFEALKVINTITGPLTTLVNIAADGAVKLLAFAGAEDAVGASASGATGGVNGLFGAVSRLASLSLPGWLAAVLGGSATVGAAALTFGPALLTSGDQARPTNSRQDVNYQNWLNAHPISGITSKGDLLQAVNDSYYLQTGSYPSFTGTALSQLGNITASFGNPAEQALYTKLFGALPVPFNSINPQDVNGLPDPFNSINPQTVNSGFIPSAPPPGGGQGTPSHPLPLTPSAGTVNAAAALLQLAGVNLGAALYQGVATGINPLTPLFSTLTSNLKGSAQTIAIDLSNLFSTAVSAGQAATQSLGINVATGQGLPQFGTQTNVTFDANGVRHDQVVSPILAQLQGALSTDKTYISDLAKLTKAGFGAGIVQQFEAAGPTSDAAIQSLLSGSSGSVTSINAAFGAVNSQAAAYGQAIAQTQYLSKIVDLETQLLAATKAQDSHPAATGAAVGASINGAAKTALHKIATTPNKGPFSRAQ